MPRRFHFKAAWTAHKDFNKVLVENWNKGAQVKDNIIAVKKALMEWNRDTFGNIHKLKKRGKLG